MFDRRRLSHDAHFGGLFLSEWRRLSLLWLLEATSPRIIWCWLPPRTLRLLEATRLLLWCPVYESHMIGYHVQAFALFAVVFIGAGFHATRNGDLLFRAFLDNVCEVFRVPTEHGDAVPCGASVFPLLRLLIEPTMRLSSRE